MSQNKKTPKVRQEEEEIEVIETKAQAVTEEDKSWQEYMLKTQQETPKRLEDAAKFLSGIISVCLTLFLKLGQESGGATNKAVMICWFASVLFTFWVFAPRNYAYHTESATTIKRAHEKIVRHKKIGFWISAFLFIGGLFIAIVSLFIHP